MFNSCLDVYSTLTLGNYNPIQADFIGKGNIWINNNYEEAVYALTKHIIAEALTNTAPGQLSIIGYDSELSGVFAPFSALTAGDTKVLELIATKSEFLTYLDYIWQQIQSVQNVIQGRTSSLLKFRAQNNSPIESYRLVVLCMDMGFVNNDTREKIAILLRNGPANGVSFLIVSSTELDITHDDIEVMDTISAFADNISILSISDKTVTEFSTNHSTSVKLYTPDSLIRISNQYLSSSMKASLPTVGFADVHNTAVCWDRSSMDGLTFTIGKYGTQNMDITIGDEKTQRHNAIITGAVGQGKSNLISMIIHSLCLHYSPDELQLFLLDFKEGVTFKAFSNIGQEAYLPHARVLGLESDQAFGFSVLSYLYDEYKKRMSILKQNNFRSISEFRHNSPTEVMPRIVAIIDEFQLMFDHDELSRQIADMLEKSVRLFRAAGIHFILASQTLSDATNTELANRKVSLFSQFPIRIALKNSIEESTQTLRYNNTAAAFLRPREAIVNLDYGEITQNRKAIIAYADEHCLKDLRQLWWDQVDKTRYTPPYVFESDRRVTVQNALSSIVKRRKGSRFPAAFVGDKISVSGESVAILMSREYGKNIAILGVPDHECNNAFGIIQSIAVSLAAQHAKEEARFVFCDFSSSSEDWGNQSHSFITLMERLGFQVSFIQPATFTDYISTCMQEHSPGKSLYIFGLSMDHWRSGRDMQFGMTSPIIELLETGPATGIHFIGWWQKYSGYNAQILRYGSDDCINTRLFLRIDERSVHSLANDLIHWKSQSNRCLISDKIELAAEEIFIPYAPITVSDISSFRSIIDAD